MRWDRSISGPRIYFAYIYGFIFLEWVPGVSPGSRRANWVNYSKAEVLGVEARKNNSMVA